MILVDLGELLRANMSPALRQRVARLLRDDARMLRQQGQRLDGEDELADTLDPPRDAQWVGVKAAAAGLGVSTRTVERWIGSGLLASQLVGGRSWVRLSDLQRIARSRPAPTAARPGSGR
jgi:hypothetical protein